MRIRPLLILIILLPCAALRASNPIFTADPAALVYKDTVYIYCGQDEAGDKRQGYVMNRWLCYSSTDMVHSTPRGSPLKAVDFSWAKGAAWASQAIERDGKFYWYYRQWSAY